MLRSFVRHRPHYHKTTLLVIRLWKQEIGVITTLSRTMADNSTRTPPAASGRTNRAGKDVSGRNTTGHRDGRHGKHHQADRRGTVTECSEAASTNTTSRYSRSRPQQGRGQQGETQVPRNNHNDGKNSYNNRRKPGGSQLRVYCSDGEGKSDHNSNSNSRSFRQMHNACQARRYKVYKPQSDAPKLLRLVEKHNHTPLHEELTAVLLENGTIDAFVVLPDTKQPYLYVCRDTPLSRFDEDPVGTETKLRNELFLNTKETTHTTDVTTAADNASDDIGLFKVSCASCLLQAYEPNGFCLVASPSANVVDEIRDKSRFQRCDKEATGRPLHPDHAHFVAQLPRSALWELLRAKTRAQKSTAVDAILSFLAADPDIAAVRDPEKFTAGIKLGHHLVSVLTLTRPSDDFWFVMGYDDHNALELDLPGGKRHLGETSMEGAIRETEEETSLVWDRSWVITALQSHTRSDGGNRYFVLHPPPSYLEHLTDNP